jgi:hypothetical protein
MNKKNKNLELIRLVLNGNIKEAKQLKEVIRKKKGWVKMFFQKPNSDLFTDTSDISDNKKTYTKEEASEIGKGYDLTLFIIPASKRQQYFKNE